ncbi:MAG: class I tRNA ligase family protein, partial [Candidatus Roizmanbacteria bacterium]
MILQAQFGTIDPMDTKFIPADHEQKIYQWWEENGYLKPKSNKKPFTVLMPPPNANASLHAGHGMYTIDDIIIRWKRLQGFGSLWIPGMDHAGFETQYVYEKHLAKEGKSRMDFDRKTLYENIFKFVKDNSGTIYGQLKRLGFLADWERSVFTLDEHVLDRVYTTFEKMKAEEYVYRGEYIVNYCTHCGTSLADLEVKYIDRIDPLYYVTYPLAGKKKFKGRSEIKIATVRPETIPLDTHIAIHPDDPQNAGLEYYKVLNPLTNSIMSIITDRFVDPSFGTGIVKLTPAHDPNDFKVAKASKGEIPIISGINWFGRVSDEIAFFRNPRYRNQKVKVARELIVEDLKEKGYLKPEDIDEKYLHRVPTCYKCGRDLESLTMPNWFVRVGELKKRVQTAVEKNQVSFYPAKFKKQMLQWLEVMHDWPISRQIVWGIRIPVWYK